MWKILQMLMIGMQKEYSNGKNHGDRNNLYVQSDTLLLVDVFEKQMY